MVREDNRSAASAAVLAVAIAVALGLTGCGSDTYQRSDSRGRGLFTARTTLMVPAAENKQMGGVMLVATSQRVLSAAADTLSDLGLKSTPDEILGRTTVKPVKNTNILAIEVTLENPEEAKIAADVIAAEFQRAYADMHVSPAKQAREFLEAFVGTALSAMNRANESLYRYRRTHKQPDVKLAQLETEAQAATEDYLMVRRKLLDAKIEEQRLKTTCALRTIDRAVVFPVRP